MQEDALVALESICPACEGSWTGSMLNRHRDMLLRGDGERRLAEGPKRAPEDEFTFAGAVRRSCQCPGSRFDASGHKEDVGLAKVEPEDVLREAVPGLVVAGDVLHEVLARVKRFTYAILLQDKHSTLFIRAFEAQFAEDARCSHAHTAVHDRECTK